MHVTHKTAAVFRPQGAVVSPRPAQFVTLLLLQTQPSVHTLAHDVAAQAR